MAQRYCFAAILQSSPLRGRLGGMGESKPPCFWFFWHQKNIVLDTHRHGFKGNCLFAHAPRFWFFWHQKNNIFILRNPLASCFCSGGAACEEPLLQSGGYAHALRRTRRRPLPEFLPYRPQDRSANGEPFPLSA